MCFLKPLRVKKIVGNKIILENKIKAIADKKVGKLKIGDKVMVYGNLIIEKVNDKQKKS